VKLFFYDGDDATAFFWCPGCVQPHPYRIKGDSAWTFNGDRERPTFTPSLMVHPHPGDPPQPRCHLFLTDGMLRFCGDSEHSLAGQSVPLPDWPDGVDQ
jgi:hypothetical protein